RERVVGQQVMEGKLLHQAWESAMRNNAAIAASRRLPREPSACCICLRRPSRFLGRTAHGSCGTGDARSSGRYYSATRIVRSRASYLGFHQSRTHSTHQCCALLSRSKCCIPFRLGPFHRGSSPSPGNRPTIYADRGNCDCLGSHPVYVLGTVGKPDHTLCPRAILTRQCAQYGWESDWPIPIVVAYASRAGSAR